MIKDQKAYDSQLLAKHGKVATIPIKGGEAYFRQPSQDEWDEMQALREDSEGAARRTPYLRLVHKCFVGAFIDGQQSAKSLDDIAKVEGPAFVSGPAGAIVNKLAGTGDRPARFLGED
jgi:hypothetical protein